MCRSIILSNQNNKSLKSVVSTFVFTSCFGLTVSASDSKPNIVLILIDDMGWKDVSYAGSSFYETPNIDKLASEGIIFQNAYSSAPVSTPSRGGLWSGKCPGRTKLTNVFDGPAGPDDRLHDRTKYRGENDQYLEAKNRHLLPKCEVIIPEPLRQGGYTTGIFGKWHIGECPGYYPDQRGFDVAKGYRRVHGVKYGHFGERWVKGNFANMPDPDSTEFIPETLTEECVKFMRANKDKPYFAVLSHYIVHTPITPRPEKVTKYENRPKTDQSSPEYAALVESVDESVGRILYTIKELGQEENTIVIFTSDNGGLSFPNVTSNYPLMGGKSFPFEAGMKVPLVIKWPNKIKPGITYERTVNTDLYPTILSAAGLNLLPKQHLDGIDLMPLLTKGEKLKERPIIFHYPSYSHATGPFSSIVDKNWKLIHFYNDAEGAYLLYDLANDPEEQHNLADTEIQRRDDLINLLSEKLKEMRVEMPIKNPNFKKTDSKKHLYNLKTTLELAKKERLLFEKRLGINRREK